MTWPRALILAGVVLVLALAAVAAIGPLRAAAGIRNRVLGRSSVEERVKEYGRAAEPRLEEKFRQAGIPYPPKQIAIVVLKEERQLRIYAETEAGWREAARYQITAASGGPGPKLREGDSQVPEGVYGIDSLNPNSLFHLALRVDYPSAEDRAIAEREGRTNLGGDIMIHGRSASVGCVAIGDAAIEEVFVLVARVRIDHAEIVIAPGLSPRSFINASTPDWLRDRYERLSARLAELEATP